MAKDAVDPSLATYNIDRYETAGKILWEVLKYMSDRSIMLVVQAC